jgi:hypothetical protein
VPPAGEASEAPPTELSLNQLKAEGQAKQSALEAWARTAYGEVSSVRRLNSICWGAAAASCGRAVLDQLAEQCRKGGNGREGSCCSVQRGVW